MMESKLHKLGVFWANYCKKVPNLDKIGCFSLENGILMGGRLGKNWYTESQIFEVRQAQPRTILVKVSPPGHCYPEWHNFPVYIPHQGSQKGGICPSHHFASHMEGNYCTSGYNCFSAWQTILFCK